MRLFDPDQLFRSQDIELIESCSQGGRTSGRGESLLWKDCAGPLTISRIESDEMSGFRLRLGDEVSVDVINHDTLAIASASDVPQITIDHFLADQVLPRVIAHRGNLVVHAGAVRNNDQAILILGKSGSGKSTLVTSFQQSGWRLMGDDALVLSMTDGGPLARAVYPSLRLFPDSIGALFSDAVASQDMAHYSSKQRIDVDVGQEAAGPAPVKAMILLGGDKPIATRRLTIAETCMALVENSFALDPTDSHHARQRLDRASRLAATVPAFLLAYPREFSRLPDVRETIESAIAGVAAVNY